MHHTPLQNLVLLVPSFALGVPTSAEVGLGLYPKYPPPFKKVDKNFKFDFFRQSELLL